MKNASQLATIVDHVQNEANVDSKVKGWIDSNTLFIDQKYIWRVGIATAEEIFKVEASVRQDLQCKHFKYWHARDFRNAMSVIRELNKHSFIFKSMRNKYLGKGSYIFTYKTAIRRSNDFYYTLHA